MNDPFEPSSEDDLSSVHPSPDAWLQGLRQGRLDIFRELFSYYAPSLVHFARLSVPFDAAEDIVQDVLFNLWELRTTVSVPEGLSTYLFGAVKNRVANYIRHERVVHRTEQESTESDIPGMGEQSRSTDHDAISNDFQIVFRTFLRSLSPMQREVLTLRWEHEMNYDQVASALGITPTAARQHGSRAARAIRPLVERFLQRDNLE